MRRLHGPPADDPVTSGAEVDPGAASSYAGTGTNEADQTWTGRCAAPACALCRRANSYLVVSPPTWVIATGIVTVLVFILAAVLSSPARAASEPGHVGEAGAGGFHGHRRQRAERDGRDGHVRPALQQRHRQRPAHRDLLAATGRRQDTHRHRHRLRPRPLTREAPTDPVLARALDSYLAAPAHTPSAWEGAYLKALDHVTFHNGAPVVPAAPDGPVPMMIATKCPWPAAGRWTPT